ncbi:GNAT family N-acetyltransferase [Actinomycetospora chibensis]|uniref:GNAT family N-acetyltransferase n=1 Tax=Actinomycetospora chibensis TaxID=663606 RepID=A0ABV9RLD4_9PSEU|nr:GNAT family N-acetyltransferase [Actinomycetospora chibensis]MDD7926105.1 GNAT family N-acetyltransferase [Actinomycetospora chibensis]
MIVRSAGLDDLGAVLDLFREASRWLAGKGIDQWQWEPRVKQVRSDIEQGNVFVGKNDSGRIIATVTVDTYADPDFWGPDDDPDGALYVHRMIVARDHAGEGIGDELTQWVEQFAGALGYDYVRLDCYRSNTGLHRYYKAHGWSHVRTIDVPWRPSGALFQRPTPRSSICPA